MSANQKLFQLHFGLFSETEKICNETSKFSFLISKPAETVHAVSEKAQRSVHILYIHVNIHEHEQSDVHVHSVLDP